MLDLEDLKRRQPQLTAKVRRHFGEAGLVWLDSLPGLVQRCSTNWKLQVEPSFADVTAGFVAPAMRSDGTPCVLKICYPEPEVPAAMEALRIWDGNGAVRLLDSDPELGASLLERLYPGETLLASMSDDDAATVVATELLKTLWVSPPATNGLIPLERWFDDLITMRQKQGGPGRFEDALLARAEATIDGLIGSTTAPVVLHGDLHHTNILSSQREPWLAIDPKGLVGDRCFDVTTFIRNPTVQELPILRRRVDIFCDALGLDRRRVQEWCFVEAMVDAAWAHNEDGADFSASIDRAELMLRL